MLTDLVVQYYAWLFENMSGDAGFLWYLNIALVFIPVVLIVVVVMWMMEKKNEKDSVGDLLRLLFVSTLTLFALGVIALLTAPALVLVGVVWGVSWAAVAVLKGVGVGR